MTDYSNACRTMLFDIDKLCWDPFLCEKLGIPMSMLPEVKPSSCIYGEVAKITGIEDIAGVPIAGAIGDQPGALFGQGCFESGQAEEYIRHRLFLLMNTGEAGRLSLQPALRHCLGTGRQDHLCAGRLRL